MIKSHPILFLLVLLSVACPGCRRKPSETPAPSRTAPEVESPEMSGAGSEYSPEVYQVKFETTKGDFVIEVHPEWSPNGAMRFRELVEAEYFEGNRFFRVVPGFIVQWGMHGDPAVIAKWRDQTIPDDPVVHPNTEGTVVFAKPPARDSRSTQLFINLGNNVRSLDSQGFSPFGEVVEGMDVVKAINAEYGESPDQGMIQQRGNEYLNENFPNLDSIKTTTIIEKPDTEKPEEEKPESTESPAASEKPTEEPSKEPSNDSPAESEAKPEETAETKEAETKPTPPKETIEEVK